MPDESDSTSGGSRRSFDLRLVYAKTPAGSAEIIERRLGLTQAARRILIVIDGQRTLADLPAFARPGELGLLLEELEQRGLIALNGVAEPAARIDLSRRAEQDRERLAALKRALQGVFDKELGGAGRLLDARVQDSVTLEVLRGVIREGIETVNAQRGESAGRRLTELVRPLISGRTAPCPGRAGQSRGRRPAAPRAAIHAARAARPMRRRCDTSGAARAGGRLHEYNARFCPRRASQHYR
ncbi:MAG TPA: hypothetical protein PKA20_17200 [Burkholderiaceae bacterium]|nr:hypothetical protein [Burkholderiaceae bacterium]